MKRILICLAGLLLAGCSTTPMTKTNAQGPQVAQQPVQYHHEIINEYNEGTTSFLHLVPNTPQ
jgi:uncharacterized lipoprotein YajG